MSEKVKVTKYEKEKIEEFLERYHLFAGVPMIKIFNAAVRGYEVEPEFEEEQWIIAFHDNGKHKCTAKITGIYSGYLTVDVINVHGEDLHLPLDGYYVIRHATLSEIAEEKERRMFEANGRDYRQFRDGDIVKGQAESDGQRLFGELLLSPGNPPKINKIETFISGLKIICFAENRLDRSGDE
ncbi:hypothetical protein [Lentibacillus amyloliquefaciens]|nr:hypothetical protein [Lentibacillus amyloliquefaciens]